MDHRTHVIVGAGLAGASAAEALRKEGFDGRIVLIGEEEHRPYERPELSKKYLRGEPDTNVFVHDPALYAECGIELRTGNRVERIDARERQVVVDGDAIAFDRLLLATGAAPRELLVPGATLDGVVTLRTIDDSDAVRERAAGASSIVVVGGGWIGSEVAASLRQLGHEVTLVVPEAVPMQKALGREVGGVFLDAHRRHGVRVVTERTVTGVDGTDRVTGVRLHDRTAIPADLVVVGIGARARDDIAAAAGLATANGVLTDEHLETSVPDVFAAGDVANAFHPRYGTHLRVEHWDNARRQGRVAAANMVGRRMAYDRLPYFYTDQYELGLEYVGYASGWDRVVLRGAPAAGTFIGFFMTGSRVAAAMHVNAWDAMADLRKVVAAELVAEPRDLADLGRPLESLLTGAPAAS